MRRWLWGSLVPGEEDRLDAEIAALRNKSTDLDQAVTRARQLVALADRVAEFENGDITWLDEIREMATRLPDADHVILSEILLGVDPQLGGRITLKGNVATSDVIAELEESLRYGENEVRGYYGSMDQTRRDYPYQIETIVRVPPDVWENGHSQGRPPFPAPDNEQKVPAQDAPAAAQRPHHSARPTFRQTSSNRPRTRNQATSAAGDSTSPQPSTENEQSASDVMQGADNVPSESPTP